MEIVYDFEKWNFADFVEFVGALQNTDFRRASELAAAVIVSWGLDIEPSAMGELDILTFRSVCRVINDAGVELLTNASNNENAEFVILLNGWTAIQNQEFVEASRNNDIGKMTELMPLIIEAWPYKRPIDAASLTLMSFEHFCEVMGAINRTFTESFAEGN